MKKTFKFTEKERFLIFHLIENEQDEGTFTLIDRIEQIVSERITPEQDTIKPYHEHGNSVASDRTESGQSAEDVKRYASIGHNQLGLDDNGKWVLYEDHIKSMRLHASHVCADKDREIDRLEQSVVISAALIEDKIKEIDRLNESLTVMVRGNDELEAEIELTYKGYMDSDAQTFFGDKVVYEERDGCSVVGAFIKMTDGTTKLASKGDVFVKTFDGQIRLK